MLPPYPLKHLADTPSLSIEQPTTSLDTILGHWPLPLPVTKPPLALLKAPLLSHNIYFDEYVSLAQGNGRWRNQHCPALLHSLDHNTLHPRDDHDHLSC
jgi:hypothetical protein